MAKILGLDLGTNSIGWAVVEKEDGEFSLVDKGVRIFQEGVKIEKGVEGSKAAERTGHRSARRIKFRRKLRKIKTLEVLSEFGYCPKLSHDELNNWRYKKVYPTNQAFRHWWMTDEAEGKNPYHFRYLCVNEQLDLNNEADRHKIGRALYHMAQRRGFLSNRLEGTKESEGAVKQSIAAINEAKGEHTLGEYFYMKYQNGEKIRDTYTHREEHYLQEFDRICDFQKIPDELKDKLHRAIFYQRPLKSQKGLVGNCVFEPKKKRCPISRIEFEEYRMLCFVNNIKIKTPNDKEMRFLNEEERQKVIARFFLKREHHFSFDDIAKQFSKKQYKYYKEPVANKDEWYLFNYSMRTTVSGCPVSARFKEVFGSQFMTDDHTYIKDHNGCTPKKITDAWHALFSFDSNQKLKEYAQKHLQLDEKALEAFLKINLKQDYASLSLKAINKVLPYLRQGLIYSHATFLANMMEVLPKDVYADPENKKIISEAIKDIIDNQNIDKKINDAINAVVKQSRTERESWSEEARHAFRTDLERSLRNQLGIKAFDRLSAERIEKALEQLKVQLQKNLDKGEFIKTERIDERIGQFICDNFPNEELRLDKIYHPSAVEVYKPAVKADDGNTYLGSPMTSSVRNPMAMRALHQLRKVINELIKEEIIDRDTKIHIEMSRGLLNANERAGLNNWQNDREKARKGYIERIKEHFSEDYQVSEDEILKYQLWEEQNHKCLYTGEEIALNDFLGTNPKYDIEHTIPASVSFDNSQENKTLCNNEFNRKVKKHFSPFELGKEKQEEILARIEHWKKDIHELEKQKENLIRQSKGAADKDSKDKFIQKRHKISYELSYLKEKYRRFAMTEITAGFKNSQLVDIGIITKYARLYIKTVFDRVYTVKGNTVADFRKIWGLQEDDSKKERINHVHHCIDAITMACMTKDNYETLAKWYHDRKDAFLNNNSTKPHVKKPWNTFAEDVKDIENELLVSHYTSDVLPKQSKKILRKRGIRQKNAEGKFIYQQGDTVRGSLHKDTFYGAIEREVPNKKGEVEKVIKYVVRKPLAGLEDSQIKNIVDDTVREVVANARKEEKELNKEISELTKQLKKAEEHEEAAIKQEIAELKESIEKLYAMPNKANKFIPIKKVRLYQPTVTNPLHIKKQRDVATKGRKEYKEHYHVANDGNYLMAIYEGKDEKGKIVRDFELVNNLDAGEFFKLSVKKDLAGQNFDHLEGLIPKSKVVKKVEIPLKATIKTGTMVIFWEEQPNEIWELGDLLVNRLYKIIGFESDGRIQFRIHQTAMQQSSQNKEEMTIVKYMKDNGLKNSEVDFKNPVPWLRLTKGAWNFLIQGIDFNISPLGKITKR